MILAEEIFKAYDIRGVVATSLTADVVELIGKALGSQMLDQGVNTSVTGRDGRLTGPELVEALNRGILSTGCNVIDIGQAPTPALYFATTELTGGTGVQVTGSHNPPEYNGLKMMIDGTTLAGEAIQHIRRRILNNDFRTGQGVLAHQEILPRYCDAIIQDISLSRSLKLVLDCGNGVAGDSAPGIFRALGCEVIELFCEVDGTFPNHHPDPGQPENLQDLIGKVKEHDADFGIAFDGDGDRLGVVSATGEVIWPDRLMALFAEELLQLHRGAEIIFDVKCSRILPEVIERNGGKATMWKTGHSLIKSKLKETGAILAGEMSGHIFFNDRWGGFDDGIYAGARLCELLTRSENHPSEIFDSIPNTINTPELRLEMDEGEHHRLVEELVRVAHFDDATVNTIDGLRVEFDDGFGLLRASNTTPSIIMRFEAGNQSQLALIQQKFRDLFASVRPGLELPF